MFSVDPAAGGQDGRRHSADVSAGCSTSCRTVPGAQAVTMSAVRPVSDNYYFVDVVRADRRQDADAGSARPRRRSTTSHRATSRRSASRSSPAGSSTSATPRSRRRSSSSASAWRGTSTGNPIGQRLGSGLTRAKSSVSPATSATPTSRTRRARSSTTRSSRLRRKDIFYAPTFEIRYAGSAAELAAVRSRQPSRRADPGLTMFRVKTLERQTEDSFARERLLAMLTSYFGGFAVLLACIGLYGLMSYGVTQRTAEMGLRMALGAPPSAVRWLVVRESAWTVIAGAAIGLRGRLRRRSAGAEPAVRRRAERSGGARRGDHPAPDDGVRRRLPPRAPRVAHRSADGAPTRLASSGGLRPPDPLTRSLARRFAGSLRSRGSLRCARSRLSSTGFAREASRDEH